MDLINIPNKENSRVTNEWENIKVGDTFTITGFGKSARCHDVKDGRSVKTGRKMKVKTLTKFINNISNESTHG